MSALPLLEMRGIGKRYPGVVALDRVDFDLRAGEVHALVGENGAGKSTLLKILAGAAAADSGRVFIDGAPVRIDSPATSQRLGVGMIHQDLKLVPGLSVAENILLGREPTRGRSGLLDRAAMARQARAALQQLGEDLPLATPVARLRAAHQQIVAIARALTREVRVLALDEPTAALSGREAANLFRLVRALRDRGVGVIYITHRLVEVFEIADRVTVLRDGRVVHCGPAEALDAPELIRLMVGRDLEPASARPPAGPGSEVLRVDQLSAPGFANVGFAVRRGEILGLAGLVGAGRTELARVIFGADPRTSGRVLLEGREIAPRSPREAIDLGIALLTEDRNRFGLVPAMTIKENITLPSLALFSAGPFLRPAREAGATRRIADQLQIKTPSVDRPVTDLSGGNRQKVVLARWLLSRSKLLIFDEPTAGVDVGAKQEIHNLIRGLARGGTGVLVISSELPELLALCDRILVLCAGAVAGELPRSEATQERIMTLAAGGAA